MDSSIPLGSQLGARLKDGAELRSVGEGGGCLPPKDGSAHQWEWREGRACAASEDEVEEYFLFDMRVDYMKEASERRATFLNEDEPYPGHKALVDRLVDAGLFYEGYNDEVTCYWCGSSINDWLEIDIPWNEHARWYPCCPLVRMTKGTTFALRCYRDSSDCDKEKQAKLEYTDMTTEELMSLEKYRKESNRRMSFRSFSGLRDSQECCEFIAQSAAQGLFYKGHAAIVECYFCGLTVRNWNVRKLNEAIHHHRSPDCVLLSGDPNSGNVRFDEDSSPDTITL